MWKDIIQDSREERKMKEEGQHLGRLFHEGWNTLSATLKMEMEIYYARQTYGIVEYCTNQCGFASNYTFHPVKHRTLYGKLPSMDHS